jgi:hypothetical protein
MNQGGRKGRRWEKKGGKKENKFPMGQQGTSCFGVAGKGDHNFKPTTLIQCSSSYHLCENNLKCNVY